MPVPTYRDPDLQPAANIWIFSIFISLISGDIFYIYVKFHTRIIALDSNEN